MRADPFSQQTTLAALNDTKVSEQQLTGELSSGARISALSDDPAAAAQGSLLRSQIALNDTFSQTAATTTSKMQIVDSTLSGVVTQMTHAISLAVEGGTGTINPANQSAIAQQLSGIRDEVLGLANTIYQGGYLFSGSALHVQPFSLDTSTTPTSVVYAGDGKVQTQQTPSGSTVPTSIPGDQVFGAAGANVLGALNQLIADFSASPTAGAITADTAAVTKSLSDVNTIRAKFDASLNRLQSAATYSQSVKVQLEAAQSTLLAADPAAVATGLKDAEVQQNALLSVLATTYQSNLFSYLK